MQTSLFDEDNLCRIGWQKALREFDLNGGLENLYSWQKTLDVPPNIDQKIEAVRRLKKEVYEDADNLLATLSALRKHYAQSAFLSPLKKEFKYLREGLNRALAKNMEPQRYEFLIPDLHPAEILVEIGAYDRAAQAVDGYIRHFGEHAFLRQIQAYALFKAGQEDRAYTAITYALFSDPLSCEERFLLPGFVTAKYRYLKHKTNRSETTWLRLPFALWLDGKTYIDPNAVSFEKELKIKTEQNKEKASRDAQVGQLQFNHLLYLSEMERLRNPRGKETDVLKELRNEMKQLNRELYEACIALLKPFRNY